jgi:UDP-2,3-diacylglucosamine hydrolase
MTANRPRTEVGTSSNLMLAEVELSDQAMVIADLHLDAFDSAACQAFGAWLRGLKETQLFVLGDLFDAWLGPAHESAAGALLVMEAFAEFTGEGGDVHLLRGNRDFLLGSSFEAASGCRVHPEGLVVVERSGFRWLFLHGDELCTRDLPYQRLRRLTHSAFVQRFGPHVPLFISKRVAARLRRHSTQVVPKKPAAELAIQEPAAAQHAARSNCAGLVCGHVHRALDSVLEGGVRWLILDAFGAGKRDTLRYREADSLVFIPSSGVSSQAGIQ